MSTGKLWSVNLGEFEHSRSQNLSATLLTGHEKRWGVKVLTEQRVQVRPDRYRIPDVCVLAPAAPRERMVKHPPFLCVEILTREDSMSSIMARVEDYFAMGVPNVWIVDPWRRRGYHCTREGMREAAKGELRTSNPDLCVALDALFD